MRWLRTYVDAPHPQLGRTGAVCPFVAPALRSDTLEMLTYHWHGEFRPDVMVGVIDELVESFRTRQWRGRNANLHALVVPVVGLPEEHWWLIDEGHRRAKDGVVAQGLMLGEFHPRCERPAVRNPFFPVNRAPVPLYALRNMAFHDVLFLHDNPRWFAEYRRRFRRRYLDPRSVDPHFAALYAAGCRLLDQGPAAPKRRPSHRPKPSAGHTVRPGTRTRS